MYRNLSENNWIASATRDPRYAILKNPGGGDCLFHVIAQASRYSISQIRECASMLVTEEEFQLKRQMYDSAVSDLKRYTSTPYRDAKTRRMMAACIRDISAYDWIAPLKTLQQYREYLKRPGCSWGDAETVGHLERLFRVKMLFFDAASPTGTYAFPSHFADDSMPERYIMVNYDRECHFELVTFGNVRVFARETLPLAVRRAFRILPLP